MECDGFRMVVVGIMEEKATNTNVRRITLASISCEMNRIIKKDLSFHILCTAMQGIVVYNMLCNINGHGQEFCIIQIPLGKQRQIILILCAFGPLTQSL